MDELLNSVLGEIQNVDNDAKKKKIEKPKLKPEVGKPEEKDKEEEGEKVKEDKEKPWQWTPNSDRPYQQRYGSNYGGSGSYARAGYNRQFQSYGNRPQYGQYGGGGNPGSYGGNSGSYGYRGGYNRGFSQGFRPYSQYQTYGRGGGNAPGRKSY
jgi:hypothetical protein